MRVLGSTLRKGLLGMGCAAPFAAALALQSKPASKDDFKATLEPFLQKYCLPCHQGGSAPGGVRFDQIKSAAQALAARPFFDHGAERLKQKSMPPPGAPQPTAGERQTALLAIQRVFSKAAAAPSDPGRVTMRRLNRAEYDNTIRDLLYTQVELAKDFPNDDVGYGFDNIGDVLTLSPLLFEKYLNAAEKVANAAIQLPDVRLNRFEGGQLQSDSGQVMPDGSLGLFSASFGACGVTTPRPGQYRIKILASADSAGPEPAKMGVRLNNKELQTFEVRAKRDQPTAYEFPVDLGEGSNRISAHFINDYYVPQNKEGDRDRNLYISAIEVVGPLTGGKPIPESHRRLIRVTPEAKDVQVAARTDLAPFLKRAFRRPVSEVEVGRFVRLVEASVKDGETFEQGMRNAVAAALVSPYFLFRVELDQVGAGKVRELNPHELASRLSYFLWSSMPDEELFRAADDGSLRKPAVLAAHAERMLKDPRAAALTKNFATQWLTLRKLESASPDPELFPEFDDQLRADMETESTRFFAGIVAEDRSIVEFLDAPYAYLNGRLAKLYGVPNVTGDNIRKVPLNGSVRGGLLTMASVLTVTSNPNRTSPVKRGKWVLENILGEPPPPPPPGLDSLEGDKDKIPAKTIKERMERHRKDPSCSVCHAKMDPLGIAFENFDAIGRWRLKDGPFAVDAKGKTPEGEIFDGASDIKKILLKKRDKFAATFTEKLMTYALGRGVDVNDRKTVTSIAANCVKSGYRFSAVIKGIVSSDAFRKKRTG